MRQHANVAVVEPAVSKVVLRKRGKRVECGDEENVLDNHTLALLALVPQLVPHKNQHHSGSQ